MMRASFRMFPRPLLVLFLLIVAFLTGRQSAQGASQRVPMTTDQFIAAMGMVNGAVEAIKDTETQIVAIMNDRIRGRYTPSDADELVKKAIAQQDDRIPAAVNAFISSTVDVKPEYTVPVAQFTGEMNRMLDVMTVKYAGLFQRYVK